MWISKNTQKFNIKVKWRELHLEKFFTPEKGRKTFGKKKKYLIHNKETLNPFFEYDFENTEIAQSFRVRNFYKGTFWVERNSVMWGFLHIDIPYPDYSIKSVTNTRFKFFHSFAIPFKNADRKNIKFLSSFSIPKSMKYKRSFIAQQKGFF